VSPEEETFCSERAAIVIARIAYFSSGSRDERVNEDATEMVTV
jgi:hypothetical protein